MNITFRTDASIQIGTGHVIRCLTLAEAFRANGANCCFICREQPGNLIELIKQRGFSVLVLADTISIFVADAMKVAELSNYELWLGSTWTEDASQTQVAAGESKVDWLIVDHYALDKRWEQSLRPLCRKLMVIDDLADRPHDCDVLLDQNLGRNASDYSQLVPKNCTILAGPQYALLRPDFAAFRYESLQRRATPKLEHLLISMGGIDQFDATGKVLAALQKCELPADLRITVVMGSKAPWIERIMFLAKIMPRPTTVKVNVHNMAQLMSDCDLAIGAAGGASWERCCLGLPTMLVVLADNQRSGATALERCGCVKLVDSIDAICYALPLQFSLLTTSNALSQLSQKSYQVTDGYGSSRVIDVLLKYQY